MPDHRKMTLPAPACAHGYTDQQVQDIMRADIDAYRAWAIGSTQTICEGELWCAEPHGVVHSERDVTRFKSAKVHERSESMIDTRSQ